MRRLWAVTFKEFIEIRRDPRTLGLAVLMPALLLIIFGFAITLDIREVPTAVCDRDRGLQSRGLVELFTASGYFRVVEAEACGREGRLLDGGRAWVYLEIPPEFGREMVSGKRPAVQVLVDGSDNNTARVVSGYVEQVLQGLSARRQPSVRLNLSQRASGPPPTAAALITVHSRAWFNLDLDSTHFIIPGLIGILAMITGVALPSMSLVRERELGSLDMLLVTPLKPHEILAGKLLPYALINLAMMALILLIGAWVFQVPFRGGIPHVLFQGLVFLLATLGMGLLISTIAKTRPAAWFVSLLTTFLPSFILSGFIFPVENMPAALQGVSFLLPATHFLVILKAVLLKGAGLNAVWWHSSFLLVFALVVMGISVLRYRLALDRV